MPLRRPRRNLCEGCAWWLLERDPQRRGERRRRRYVFTNGSILLVEAVPVRHFRVEHPEIIVVPAEPVLRRQAQRGSTRLAKERPDGHVERDVAYLEEVLRFP